jgi:hypothetical protein
MAFNRLRSRILGFRKALVSIRFTFRWPSGISQTTGPLALNRRHVIVEGACHYQPEEIVLERDYICEGESIELTAPEGEDHIWSTGEMGEEIVVCAGGILLCRL